MRDRTEEFKAITLLNANGSSTVPDERKLSDNDNKVATFIKQFLIKVEDLYNKFSVTDQRMLDVIDLQRSVLEFSETDETVQKSFDENQLRASSIDQICNIQLLTLKRKLTTCVSNYYNIQEEYRVKCRSRVKRLAEIVGVDVSRLNIEEAMGTETKVLMRSVIADFDVTNQYMMQIEKRHEEILKLEKSITELVEVFSDQYLVTKIDSALVDRIDKHVDVNKRLITDGSIGVKEYRAGIKRQKIVDTAILDLFVKHFCGPLSPFPYQFLHVKDITALLKSYLVSDFLQQAPINRMEWPS